MSSPALSLPRSKAPSPQSEPLPFSAKLSFGAGDFGPAITANLLIFFWLYFLTAVAGLSPGLAGLVLFADKIGHAISTLVVGVLSDRTQSRWGRRYPWIVLGSAPFSLSFFLLWLVPFESEWALFWYYLTVIFAFKFAYNAITLPYVALTPQISNSYNERTQLNTFRFTFSIGGKIASLILAQQILRRIHDPVISHLVLGGVCAIAAMIPIGLFVVGTYRRVISSEQVQAEEEDKDPGDTRPLVQQIAIALKCRPFQYVVGIYLCSWSAVQLISAMTPFFVVSWMGLPESEFPNAALAIQGTAIACLSLWGRLSKTVGKQGVYFMGASLWLVAQVGLLLLQPGQVPLMYVLCMLAGVGVSTAYLIPWSMLPDVVDANELETGERHEGTFYSLMIFLQKLGLAIALWLMGQIIELSGYVEGVSEVQPDSALLAIRLLTGMLPAIALITGMYLATSYPITAELHAEILHKLKARKASTSPIKG
ncbi:MAG: MFS transporter [Cyanobacteria bacterium P01_D01_bin.73]